MHITCDWTDHNIEAVHNSINAYNSVAYNLCSVGIVISIWLMMFHEPFFISFMHFQLQKYNSIHIIQFIIIFAQNYKQQQRLLILCKDLFYVINVFTAAGTDQKLCRAKRKFNFGLGRGSLNISSFQWQ